MAAALAVALLGATPSQAGLVVLDFDLSGSALRLGSAVDVADGRGAAVSGRALVDLRGVDGQGRPLGPTAQGTLSRLDLTFFVNTPILPGIDASLIGPVRIMQVGMARGPFDGMAVRADGFDGGLSLNLNCVGSLCPAVAQATMTSFPIIQNVTFSTPIAVTLRGLGTGRVTLDAAVMGMSSGLAFSLSLRGQAPEPLEAGLLGLGLLALCASAAVRLRRA